ncbi:hypothetical protein GRI58_15125 [Porphyrobacter algicida]|uniref:MobA/MobL protein domain-containing protein n=1 Tax=Qipengyuania algicida TaxID=1836209 RepID=A0A845AIQ5_9SPHN|nr:hypothetical protein [Qipengyuania algicida]MXP30140.1 hypothetical protein [Qipengyuania algicida]
MAKRVTSKTSTALAIVPISQPASVPSADPVSEPELAKPRVFIHDVCTDHPDLSYSRYWWDQKHDREGITPWIAKKLCPGDDPIFGHAAKAEVLLPPTAPSDYMDVHFLTSQFDRTLPSFEKHAMVQMKLFLDQQEAWHIGYERVRSFARAHFAATHPVILIAHVPQIVGLEGNGSHVHCVVLSRGINVNGFTPACTTLCSDRGYRKALAAWRKHLKAEGKGA